MSHSS